MDAQIIRVLIVHEYPLMCDIIAKVLDGEEDIRVIGFATTIDEADRFILADPVDVVPVSPRLPEGGSVKLTNELMRKSPATRILILGISESREQVLQYLEAGASGYVIRESSVEDLLRIIRATYDGKALISPEMASALIQRVTSLAMSYKEAGIPPPDISSLTAREMEVLQMLAKKHSNQEIASKLVIGQGTVKNHIHKILEKLGAVNREEAAALYTHFITNWADDRGLEIDGDS